MQDKKGFTLIELLIVVVIIGILAAIAIPKFSSTREKAYVSAMKSDLKNLATQEEIYYSSVAGNYTYTTSLTDLGFTPSEGVTVAVTVSGNTWSATADHNGTDQQCSLSYGTTDANDGVVTCTTPTV